jgi:hypothetical protein
MLLIRKKRIDLAVDKFLDSFLPLGTKSGLGKWIKDSKLY